MLGLTLTGTFAFAATLSTIIRLTTYAVTCAALPILRRRSGGKAAPFSAPAGSAVAVISMLLIGWLYLSSSWIEVRLALLAAILGLFVFVIARPRTTRTAS
jgi:basic amino acid/polyamine antiporter, APA family